MASNCFASFQTRIFRDLCSSSADSTGACSNSAFRLGEAQGLNMAGPLEKPVRLEELEALLKRLKPVVPS